MGKRPRFFDSEFKIMAVELSYAKGTAASAAKELGINDLCLASGEGIPGSILVLMS